MNYNRGNIFSSLPPVTKNLLIINVVVFGLMFLFASSPGLSELPKHLQLWNFQSPNFKPYQLITYMFMHGGFGHLFFNMFGVFMFGRILESVWGPKKYLTLYILSGLGAALIHLTITYLQIQDMIKLANVYLMDPTAENFWAFLKENGNNIRQEVFMIADKWLADPTNNSYIAEANYIVNKIVELRINIPMVGASGAVFGILVAFAMMFPNVELMIIFLPVPIKAKYLVPVYAVIELFMGVANFQWDNVAHFAHLGGALVGFILVRFWKKNQFQQF